MKYDINKLVSEMDFSKNSLEYFGNNIYLTKFEIEVLDKYGINYKNCTDLKSIIFLIEDILKEDDSIEDLDVISNSIAERDYYLNTNK